MSGGERQTAIRIPWYRLDDLTGAQRELHRLVLESRRPTLADEHGRLAGPFNFMLSNPQIAAPLERLGCTLRFGGSLPDLIRELVILSVARAQHSNFEWDAHAAVARKLGISQEQLDEFRQHGSIDGFDEAIMRVVMCAQRLIEVGDLTDDEYADAESVVGADGVMEVIVLIGYYRLLATGMRVFGAPGGAELALRDAPS
jgi:4-carboxymuconolactone decarboxylase